MAGQIRTVKVDTNVDGAYSTPLGIVLETNGDAALLADPSFSGSGAAGIVLVGGLAPIGALADGTVAPAPPPCLTVARQADGKFGEFAGFAVDRDRAAVLLRDDVVADRQAEPGSLPGRLGREKRLKQLVPDLRRNPGAIVAHPDLDHLAEIAGRHLEGRAIGGLAVAVGALVGGRRSRC